MRRLLIPLALMGLGLQIGAAQILTLDEVIASVNRSYPPLLAALLEIEVAEANVMAAQGRFDLRVRASMEADQFGFYSNERIFTGLEQPTAMQGTSFFGGWRMGSGSFAPYDGRLDTRSLGEWRGGMLFPLARNRAIDDRRAGLRKAEIGRGIASLSVAQQRLVIIRFAAQRYWSWVAAGRRQAIVEASLKIALDRQEALEESVRLGQLPAIDVIDNQRTVLQRRSLLVEAQQLLQQAAIDLSLFYRDPQGNPIVVGSDRLPMVFPSASTLSDRELEEGITAALLRRPEIDRLRAELERERVDRELARNQVLPGVDLGLGFTTEGGEGSVRRGPQEVKASLNFELPFQRRTARGSVLATEARIGQISQQRRFVEDQIRAEVRDAAVALRTAFERVGLLGEEVGLTREVEEAERIRFQLGDSTLFLVNLRELATVDAEVREVAAQADYFRAVALYEYATAQTLP